MTHLTTALVNLLRPDARDTAHRVLVSLLLPTSACCSAAQEKPSLLSGVSGAKFHTVKSWALNSVRVRGLCNSLHENNLSSLPPSAVL